MSNLVEKKSNLGDSYYYPMRHCHRQGVREVVVRLDSKFNINKSLTYISYLSVKVL